MSADRPPEDLTARARIRDAALAEFAEHGVKGATIRGVAAAAGVSPGLVQHHFGSKEGLRTVCDEAVVAAFRTRLTARAADGSLGDQRFLAEMYATSGPMLRYLSRALLDGSAAAAAVFEDLVAGAADFLSLTWPDRFARDSERTRQAASTMTAMHLGTVVLHDQLAPYLGGDPLDQEHATRVGTAMLDVYGSLGEFAASPTADRIRESAAAYRDNPGEDR